MEQNIGLNLHLFDGSAAGEHDGASVTLSSELAAELDKIAPPAAGEAKVVKSADKKIQDKAGEGTTDERNNPEKTEVKTDEPADLTAEFEKLIKGEYKEVFDKRVQGIIGKKTKENAAIRGKLDSLTPIMDKLAMRYDVDAEDIKALSDAIDHDVNYLENQAAEAGMDVNVYQKLRQAEYQAKQFERQQQEAQRRQQFENLMNGLRTGSEGIKQTYPSFDFDAEMQNADFADLVFKGIDVKKVYELIHHDEIMSGAMAFTAQKTAKDLVDGIKAKGMRPLENGSSGGTGIATKTDVSKLTDSDIDDILRRVGRGEEIRF